MDKAYIQGKKCIQEDYDLPTDELVLDTDFGSEELLDKLGEEINDYLADKYGYCVNGYGWQIVLNDIDWDTTE